MKDMPGVMLGFAKHVDPSLGAHLLLCGPAVTGVADDPEGARCSRSASALWRALPHAARSRVHLACTPMADPDEAAAIVNALQRHAAIVVQKSSPRASGSRSRRRCGRSGRSSPAPSAASSTRSSAAEHGLLVDDPHDLAAFGAAVERLLRDERAGEATGTARPRARYGGVPRRPPPPAVRPDLRAPRVEADQMLETEHSGRVLVAPEQVVERREQKGGAGPWPVELDTRLDDHGCTAVVDGDPLKLPFRDQGVHVGPRGLGASEGVPASAARARRSRPRSGLLAPALLSRRAR